MRLPVARSAPGRRRAVPTLRVIAGRDMLKFATLGPAEQVLVGRDESAWQWNRRAEFTAR